MNKVIIIFFMIFAYQQSDTIASWFQEPVDYSSINKEDVTLYSTTWCGYCAKTRRFLEKNKIPYIEHDIEKSDIGKQQYAALGGGPIPLLLVKGKLVRGYDTKLITQYLNPLKVEKK